MRYKVRDIINMSVDDVHLLDHTTNQIQFDDETVEMSGREVIHSHYYWEMYRVYPIVPKIVSDRRIQQPYTKNIHLELGWDIINDIRIELEDHTDIWPLSKLFFEIGNKLHHLASGRLSEYVTSGSIYDLLEVMENPVIMKAKETYRAEVSSRSHTPNELNTLIRDTNLTIRQTILSDTPDLKKNEIARMCRTKVLNMGQLLQVVGIRGYVQDIDTGVFKEPVHVGYADGLTTMHDSAVESRSASKALINNKRLLESTEYTNRELQLLAGVILRDENETCHSFVTIPIMVGEDDLFFLRGKYYMEDNLPVMIWDNINHLVGKVINLRTITGCGNENRQTVCRTCIGYAGHFIPKRTNLGFSLIVPLSGRQSSIVLSTKHLESSAGALGLSIPSRLNHWFKIFVKQSDKIYLTRQSCNKNPIIRISIDDMAHINTILNINVEEIAPSAITHIKELHICSTSHGEPVGMWETIDLTVNNKGSSLTKEVLLYLSKEGWSHQNNYIEFQLVDWDYKQPLIDIPQMGENLSLYMEEFKRFLMPTKKTSVKITNFTSRGVAITELSTLIRRKVSINIIQAEVLVRACMCVDGYNGNFSMPGPTEPFEIISAQRCIHNRSISGMMAYQNHFDILKNPDHYTVQTHNEHMLDQILHPDPGGV